MGSLNAKSSVNGLLRDRKLCYVAALSDLNTYSADVMTDHEATADWMVYHNALNGPPEQFCMTHPKYLTMTMYGADAIPDHEQSLGAAASCNIVPSGTV